jgi:hypothetical protein
VLIGTKKKQMTFKKKFKSNHKALKSGGKSEGKESLAGAEAESGTLKAMAHMLGKFSS